MDNEAPRRRLQADDEPSGHAVAKPRRGIADPDDSAPVAVPRRSSDAIAARHAPEADHPLHSGSPTGLSAHSVDADPPLAAHADRPSEGAHPRRRLGLAALAIALVLALGVGLLTQLLNRRAQEAAPNPPVVDTPSPSSQTPSASPTPTPTEQPSSSTAPTPANSATATTTPASPTATATGGLPSATATPSPSTPNRPTPASSAAPNPTAPVVTPSGAPSASPPASTPFPVKLNDTSFTGAAGWVVYRDDMVDDDRRLVALKENKSGVRLQVVTLNNDVSAGDSCQALVTSQSQDYKNAVASLTVPVGVPAKLADAVTCGFHGTSPTTKKGTQVTFTVAKRHKDDVTLILRSTIPDGQPPASPAKAQLAAMSCQASQSFGVPLPLC